MWHKTYLFKVWKTKMGLKIDVTSILCKLNALETILHSFGNVKGCTKHGLGLGANHFT
jgi:hypothetical protein